MGDKIHVSHSEAGSILKNVSKSSGRHTTEALTLKIKLNYYYFINYNNKTSATASVFVLRGDCVEKETSL